MTTYDIDIVGDGIRMLRDALDAGRVTVAAIQSKYDSDQRLLEAREYWGDRSDEQRLITRGIKLRQIARRTILDQEASRGRN